MSFLDQKICQLRIHCFWGTLSSVQHIVMLKHRFL